MIAILENHDFEILVFEYFIALQHVVTVAGIHEFGLSLGKPPSDIPDPTIRVFFDLSQIDYLDRHVLVRVVVDAPIHRPICPFPKETLHNVLSNFGVEETTFLLTLELFVVNLQVP